MPADVRGRRRLDPASSAAHWPRLLPSDFRVRSLDGVGDDWPIDLRRPAALLRADRPRRSASPASSGDPAYPPGTRAAAAAAPDRTRRAQGGAGMNQARLALVAGAQRDRVAAATADRRPLRPAAARARRAARRAPRPSSDLTHWPRRSSRGARSSPAPGSARSRSTRAGGRRGAVYIDRDGAEHHQQARRRGPGRQRRSGRRACCCCRAQPRIPTASPTRPGWSASGLMLHPIGDVAGLYDEPTRELAGPARPARSTRSSSTRPTTDARLRARRQVAGRCRRGGPLTRRCRCTTARRSTQRGGRACTTHVRAALGHGVDWGVDRRGPARRGQRASTLDPTLTDGDGIPAPEIRYTIAENTRRHAGLPPRARARRRTGAAGALATRSDR